MSAGGLSERLRPTAEMLMHDARDNNSYILYFNEKLCPADSIMVREYHGHKELVRVLGVDNIQLLKFCRYENPTPAHIYSGGKWSR